MQRIITIAADDFGLTRGITDSILETVDRGPVTLVSIIPNGEAVAYAVDQYKKRSKHLELAVHLNLTEGKALSAPKDIPHLVDAHGVFEHSVIGLWCSYVFSRQAYRSVLRAEVRTELGVQCAVIRAAIDTDRLVVNGHQHVHLVPFVFDEIIQLQNISKVRTVREPFQWTWRLWSIIAWSAIFLLSRRATRLAAVKGITTNDSFVGFLYSGRMSKRVLDLGLARAFGSVEVLFHPGSAREGEFNEWNQTMSDIAWHYSPQRARERELLTQVKLESIGKTSRTWHDFWNSEHAIYVSETHKKAHYKAIARDVIKVIRATYPLTLLDYGCGDALSSLEFANSGIHVSLYDPVPRVQRRLQEQFGSDTRITIVKNMEMLVPRSFDVILVNSVLQYISKKELATILLRFRSLLKVGGQLILADVIPSHTGVVNDVYSLLRGAWRHQYLPQALRGLVSTFFSDYRTIQKTQGFSTYSQEELIAQLEHAGFSGVRAANNIGLTPHRMTFLAT